MAKKKRRVPAPPRSVQAPRKRVEPRDPRRTRMWFIALGLAIVAAAAVVGIALAVRGGEEESSILGPCVRQEFADQGQNHVDKLEEGFTYNSFPATSGPHSSQTAIWNLYDRPVPELNVVHNLEHGGVVVQYGNDVPPAAVNRIAAWYAEDPNGLIVAPLPEKLPARAPENAATRIFLTAWGHRAACSAFHADAFSDFRDDYRGEGPEGFPVDSLQPGSQ